MGRKGLRCKKCDKVGVVEVDYPGFYIKKIDKGSINLMCSNCGHTGALRVESSAVVLSDGFGWIRISNG